MVPKLGPVYPPSPLLPWHSPQKNVGDSASDEGFRISSVGNQ